MARMNMSISSHISGSRITVGAITVVAVVTVVSIVVDVVG